MREVLDETLPPNVSYEWTGMTVQEIQAAGQAMIAMGLAVLFVYLFLCALYESWIIPIAVLLIAPVAIFGALLAISLRGLENNLFFQVAMISLVGMAAKNSILIVEFAKQLVEEGKSFSEAALESARLRFRPIMMTAISFIFGVMPLVLSEGPGAIARQSISTAVLGGMILATSLGILLVPLFNAGGRRAELTVAQSRFNRVRLAYEQVVLEALREVSNALNQFHRSGETLQAERALEQATQDYLNLATKRYRNGVLSYIDVLDAQRQLFEAQIAVNLAREAQLLALVDLYKALGGGWEPAVIAASGE